MPRISESTGTFSEVAGSSGRDDRVVAQADDHALQRIPVVPELTIFAMTVSFLRQRFSAAFKVFGWRVHLSVKIL